MLQSHAKPSLIHLYAFPFRRHLQLPLGSILSFSHGYQQAIMYDSHSKEPRHLRRQSLIQLR